MTIKRAILIGTLLATTIALITIGVKTGSFDNKNNENYKPKLLSRNSTAIRVNAETSMPISKKWLLNEDLSNASALASTNINVYVGYVGQVTEVTGGATFNSSNYYTNSNPFTSIGFDNNHNFYTYRSGGKFTWYTTSNNWQVRTSTSSSGFYTSSNTARVLLFNTEPNGNLLAWLNANGTPVYNDSVVISNNSGMVREITKQDTPFTMPQLIRNDGLIKIYLDAGTTTLYINGTKYTNLDDAISIANDDVIITTYGTQAGQTSSIFKILYTNSLTPVSPDPDPIAPYYDVIDLKPLMLNILTMPFTFISQAFNVTLWPGTQYEFNISNFILSIIAIATILFIIRLFTSGFSVIGNYTGARNDKAFKKSQTRLNNAKAKNIENNTPRKSESHVTIKKEK